MTTTVTPRRRRVSRVDTWMDGEWWGIRRQKVALVILGAWALVPDFFISRGVITGGVLGNSTLNASVADVLGSGGELLFLLMLLVTPLALVTRQRWFIPLRQWYGIMFAVTVITDATIASITTAFAGGPGGRLAGHSFLLVGFTMVILSVPLLVTANNWFLRRLGRYWKPVQRYGTFAIWGLLFLHLTLLEGFGPNSGDGVRMGVFHQRMYQLAACSLPLAVLRLPPVRRWVTARQRDGRAWLVYLAVVPLAALFVLSYCFIVNEEMFTGIAAFTNHPIQD
jgi:sulfoxide reductase heme-binding subunit YedZ